MLLIVGDADSLTKSSKLHQLLNLPIKPRGALHKLRRLTAHAHSGTRHVPDQIGATVGILEDEQAKGRVETGLRC